MVLLVPWKRNDDISLLNKENRFNQPMNPLNPILELYINQR